MKMFSVEVDINFDALQKNIKERIEFATLSLLADMKDTATDYAYPQKEEGSGYVRSGNLGSKMKIDLRWEGSYLVGRLYPTVHYAPYVEYGTGIHAVNGNGRQEKWKYQTPDGRWVTTEGMEPRLFMTKTYKQYVPIVKDYYLDIV
ncbi:hypothetical protein [Turicibacter sanguinis]|uniref:hypothetical protein n=1 Tax=Turicibacter sanguinis TaxID=154288 RepID=UPI0018AB8A09|nr:hypothetical protein [Turicibacter sanguinis]MDB8553877.1 hypothetical protein [Turicibacter sanguinis]